jgi:hypothetical protein
LLYRPAGQAIEVLVEQLLQPSSLPRTIPMAQPPRASRALRREFPALSLSKT